MQRLSNNGIGYEVGKSLDPDDCGETRMKWEKRKKRIEFAWKCLVIFKNHSKGCVCALWILYIKNSGESVIDKVSISDKMYRNRIQCFL